MWSAKGWAYSRMIFTGPVESFFKAPVESLEKEGDGILYNLRSDLAKLYDPEDRFDQDPSEHAMLATIGILIGFDYISKVYSPEEYSGDRFVETIKDLASATHEQSEALYQFRNALAHSFSLVTTSNRAKFRKGDELSFQLTDRSGAALINKLSDTGQAATDEVSFWELKRCFLQVIAQLRSICSDSDHRMHTHVLNKVGEMHSQKLVKR